MIRLQTALISSHNCLPYVLSGINITRKQLTCSHRCLSYNFYRNSNAISFSRVNEDGRKFIGTSSIALSTPLNNSSYTQQSSSPEWVANTASAATEKQGSPDSSSDASASSSEEIIIDLRTPEPVSSDLYGWMESYIKFFESVSSSTPVLKMMEVLRHFHDITGLPWWSTIILSTVIMRTSITFPLGIYQQYIMAKVELLRGEMMTIMQKLAHETRVAKKRYNWSEGKARRTFKLSCREHWKRLIERENCHPGKGVILVLFQLPLWITMSIAYRNLATTRPFKDVSATQAFFELYSEGTVWCPHLTHPDPVLLLPVMMALINLTITEVHALQRPPELAHKQKFLTNFFRVVSVISFPIACFMPSGVVLYWCTSSSCALLQTLVFLHPGVKDACRIPLTPSTHLQPYSRMMLLITDKLVNTRLGKRLLSSKSLEQNKKKKQD